MRSATRDHLPMVGALPDYQATVTQYQDLQRQNQRGETVAEAPVYPGLFAIGGLGSRGLCSRRWRRKFWRRSCSANRCRAMHACWRR